MKVCVLLPDYSTSTVDYQNYDPPRDLSNLLPNDLVETVFLNKLSCYKQLKDLSKKGFDIFVNLCEGYLEWNVPSIDVIYTLELLNLPYTGPNLQLYDPSKELMKYVAYCANVKTPAYQIITSKKDLSQIQLQFPLFVKPAKAGDSLGIDKNALVKNIDELQKQVEVLLIDYDEILVEEYIAGREFTVMVLANKDGKTCKALEPVEYIFPEDYTFKTYSLKTSELHTEANIPIKDVFLSSTLKKYSENIFTAFNGVGYARLDFRMNEKIELFFLEINFTCSVFYTDGYEGSADYILKYDGIGQQQFLQHIIEEGITRYNKKQLPFIMKGNAIAGYGIYATKNIEEGEIIFKGEEKAQRIVTKKYVEENWTEKDKEDFARYAYPISNNVFVLWDEDAKNWAPQNHSCNANTAYLGLNVVALNSIQIGEELTLDYASFLNEEAQSFTCSCKSKNCRGIISGASENSIENRLMSKI
ncbi:MAG: SET domain-containing protein-lysine N-methyltransferase [Chitinophagaceae bacterium]|nr:SET domain-containing protein-lysine N-methyltransferase [Chitinophagaceae bacterium]